MPSPKNTKAAASSRSRQKYTPAHGRDFDLNLRDLDSYKTARTRDNIVYVLLGACLAALLAAAGYGFYAKDFGALRDVWAVAGPFISGVAGYYMHRSRKDSE